MMGIKVTGEMNAGSIMQALVLVGSITAAAVGVTAYVDGGFSKLTAAIAVQTARIDVLEKTTATRIDAVERTASSTEQSVAKVSNDLSLLRGELVGAKRIPGP